MESDRFRFNDCDTGMVLPDLLGEPLTIASCNQRMDLKQVGTLTDDIQRGNTNGTRRSQES